MKYLYSPLSLIVFFVSIILLAPTTSLGQLSGNYTIDPGKAASSSNYQNWASAVGDLVSGSRTDGGTAQGPGVSAAVNITVADQFYTTAVEIAAITGVSYTNRITFKSTKGDSSKCMIITASSSSATNNYVLSLNGADYITFQGIGFERSGKDSFCNVVVVTNSATNNKFDHCFIKGKRVPSNSTEGFTRGMGTCFYFMGAADSTIINQCRIMYGYNGIFNTSGSNAIVISGNNIDTSGSSGIYFATNVNNGLRIIGNTLNMGDFGAAKGHYVSYAMRIENSPGFIMANNKIFMYAVNATVCRAIIIATTNSTWRFPALVYNNSLVNNAGTTSCTGFAVYNSSCVSFINNNVLITNTFADGAAFHLYPTTNGPCDTIKLINNNFINKGGGYAITVPDANGSSNLDSVNFNNLYTTGKYIGLWNATKITDLSTWQSTTSRDANSLNLDPGYQSNTNLHVSSIAINGKAIPYPVVTLDIDGDSRDKTNPDIGSDEFFPIAIDAGVSNLDSPMIFSAGKQIIKATFQNFGYDTLKTVDLYLQINGGSPSSYSWSGKLAPGASSSPVNLGSFTFSANTAYKFKIWTKNPNKTNDGKAINDTLTIIRYPAMSGNYTIGDTSIANYHSFNEAITAMTARGVSGATTFDVYKGKFTEQLGFGILPGMGASSPITFQSKNNDSTSVLITLPSTTATGTNNAAVQLRGASYVTFKKISFERTGTNAFGQVIHVINGSHHNTFANCQMKGLTVSTLNLTAHNIWSDAGTDNFNTFKNNYITNGTMNMLFSGLVGAHETGNVIEGNIFESGFNNSVQLNYNDSATVKGNIFRNVLIKTGGNYSLQLVDCDNRINVNGNYFNSSNADTACWLMGCNGTAANNGIIANNSTIRVYGKTILLDGVDYQNVVFNTLCYKSNTTTSAAISTTTAASTNIVLKNNLIVMDNGIGFNINTGTEISASDNNNFFIKGGAFAYWGGVFNTLASLSVTTGMDKKSTTLDPLFLTSSDLHIKNYLLKGKAEPISGVTTDFDGETRNATTPDIGADEFKLVPNDAGMINVVKPTAGTCAGVLDVWAVIKNYGNDNLKSATITWTINGSSQAPYTYSGNLKTNATDTVKLGTFNFVNAFNPKFTVRTFLPNGQTDGLGFNDSVIITRTLRALPNANAGTDITICTGDTITIGPGPTSGVTYKWTTISGSTIGTASQIRVNPTAKTKYVLEVTNTTFGCVNRDTIEVNINNKPSANAGKDQTVCPGTTVQLGETPQTGFSYSWTSLSSSFTSSIANPSDMPIFSTTYFVEKKVTGSGCLGLDTVTITLATVPTPKINGIDKLCNKAIQNYYTNNNATNTYKWIIKGAKVLSGLNTNSLNVEWDTAGIGILKVVETNPTGCFDTSAFYVTVSPNPTADFTFKGTCLTNISTFTNLSVNAQTYGWTFGDGITSTGKDPIHTYAIALSYNVRLVAKNSFGCNDTMTKLVPIEPLPSPNFTYSQKSGNTIDFKNTSTIPSGSINSWVWKFGHGTDSSLLENPTHTFPNSANYSVTLCVKAISGCDSCITKLIGFSGIKNVLVDAGLIIFPNPGSGLFTIQSTAQMASILVLNTLGQTVKTFNPIASEFKFNLSDQPNGVYFIKIETNGKTQVLRLVKE